MGFFINLVVYGEDTSAVCNLYDGIMPRPPRCKLAEEIIGRLTEKKSEEPKCWEKSSIRIGAFPC